METIREWQKKNLEGVHSCGELIERMLDIAYPEAWYTRHIEGWKAGRQFGRVRCVRGHESGVVLACEALAAFADASKAAGMPIGEDGYGSDYWLDMLKATRALLNFDCGRLDCGTVDTLLMHMAKVAGYTDKELQENGLI